MSDQQVDDDIERVERYRFVTHMIEYHNEKIIQAVRIFISLITAVCGGVFYLKAQGQVLMGEAMRYGYLADALVTLIGFVVWVTLLANLAAWLGFRSAESRLRGKDAHGKWRIPPTRWWKCYTEYIYLIAIPLVCAGFAVMNPLTDRADRLLRLLEKM